jgi:small-conductance mechanosensitive channel
MEKIQSILGFNLLPFGDYQLTIGGLLLAFVILIAARLLSRLLQRLIKRQIKRRSDLDAGRLKALGQILKYVLYVIAILIALEAAGIKITWVIGASAALFVGLGFGLQNTFNDFVSGIIILFDGSLEEGDVLQVGTLVGIVKHIKLRTTILETNDSISVIVPNSKLTGENVINWSHNDGPTRYKIKVGVSYGSDIKVVKKGLEEAAQMHPAVLAKPGLEVRFDDFGESALEFILLFWSNEDFGIEPIKSQIRYNIDEIFRKYEIEIPFPQRDIHIKSRPAE